MGRTKGNTSTLSGAPEIADYGKRGDGFAEANERALNTRLIAAYGILSAAVQKFLEEFDSDEDVDLEDLRDAYNDAKAARLGAR